MSAAAWHFGALARMGWTRILQSAEVRPACPEAVDAADWHDIQAALDGESDAYSRLVRRYQQPIGSYMWRFTRDRGQWEELVQDVFVEAYLTLASYRGRAPLLHWLRRIATRVGYRWWRERARRRAQAPATVRDWDQLLADDRPAASPGEAAQVVHEILQRASARDRLVLTLLYLEECSVQEISQLTGWSVAMVKVQAFRARKRLGKILEQMQ